MEKKEMSFADKFEAAGKELEKAMVESNKDAMIMIATSEGRSLDESLCYIEGNKTTAAILLAYAAIKDKGFKTILTNAIKGVEAYEQRNK